MDVASALTLGLGLLPAWARVAAWTCCAISEVVGRTVARSLWVCGCSGGPDGIDRPNGLPEV